MNLLSLIPVAWLARALAMRAPDLDPTSQIPCRLDAGKLPDAVTDCGRSPDRLAFEARARLTAIPIGATPVEVATRRPTADEAAVEFVGWLREHGVVGEVLSRVIADVWYQEWCMVSATIPVPRRDLLAAFERQVASKYERRTYGKDGRENGKPTYYLIGSGSKTTPTTDTAPAIARPVRTRKRKLSSVGPRDRADLLARQSPTAVPSATRSRGQTREEYQRAA